MATGDKPFTNVDPCGSKSFDNPVVPTSSFGQPPDPAVDIESGFPNPFGDYQLKPDQTVAIDLIIPQFLNRQALFYKAIGEEMVPYHQKEFGEQCACVDRNREQPQDGCLICFGTRFVGGYDVRTKTIGYIGPNPLAKLMTELGIAYSQKPSLWTLPDPTLRDRDFIVARGRLPTTELTRFQQEPVIRAVLDPNFDALNNMNVYRIIHISRTKGGSEDFVENVDFILTGGELVVEDALTAPPNADARTLRIVSKKFPLSPPDGETPTGETDPVPDLTPESGLKIGETVTVLNKSSKPQIMTGTLAAGTGADAAFLVATFQGDATSGISDVVAFPTSKFIASIKGDTIQWIVGAERPADFDTYFVTYEASLNITRRYQIINVMNHHYQGTPLVQQAEIELMDPNHPIYSVLSIFDNGIALDRQSAAQDKLKKDLADNDGLERNSTNVVDPRFVNPEEFNL